MKQGEKQKSEKTSLMSDLNAQMKITELENRLVERSALLEEALEALSSEIAQRKLAEENLLLAKNEILNSQTREDEFNKRRLRFINVMSHEYRTPLTIIHTCAFFLKQLNNEHKVEVDDKISQIKSAIKRLVKLFDDVLLSERLDTKSMEMYTQEIELVDFIKQIIDETKVADKNVHEFIFESNEAIVSVLSDKYLLKNIFSNLLSNAIKFSDLSADISIKIKDEKDKVQVSIKNWGIGILEKDMKYIFEPYFRGSNIKTISGTGLGLWIVKKSCDELAAEIKFSSKENNMTEFTIVLNKFNT